MNKRDPLTNPKRGDVIELTPGWQTTVFSVKDNVITHYTTGGSILKWPLDVWLNEMRYYRASVVSKAV